MNEFAALRTCAKSHRDKAIARAQEDYNAALRPIATIKQDLPVINPLACARG